jgi:hypothetical protein
MLWDVDVFFWESGMGWDACGSDGFLFLGKEVVLNRATLHYTLLCACLQHVMCLPRWELVNGVENGENGDKRNVFLFARDTTRSNTHK